jgi:hypothetical protein
MSNKSNSTVTTMGIDIGKNSFHVVGLDQRGAIVLRQKWSRGQVAHDAHHRGAGGRLDERIEGLFADIASLVQRDPACQRLMTVPGIGPIISSAMVAGNRHWRCVLQRPRLRRLAWTGAETDVDRRPHHPGQDIEARQSLPARPVRAGSLGWPAGMSWADAPL